MSIRSRTWRFLTLVALLTQSISVANAQRATTLPAPTTAPATTPTTAPEPSVDNPHYLAWRKHKPGTQVEMDVNLVVGGQQITTNVTTTLSEVTPERVVVQSVAKLNVPGLFDGEQHDQTHTFRARVPLSEATRAMLPPGGEGDLAEIGAESVQAAGKTYETKIFEFDGTVQGAPATARQWRSDEVPGGLVKMESGGANGKMELILKKVTTK